jgi:hypothetical protein
VQELELMAYLVVAMERQPAPLPLDAPSLGRPQRIYDQEKTMTFKDHRTPPPLFPIRKYLEWLFYRKFVICADTSRFPRLADKINAITGRIAGWLHTCDNCKHR